MIVTRRAVLSAAAVATLLAVGTASADDYPSRPITMIVPFAAGGPTDTVARLIAEPMTQALGQQVVVENVGGAGGTLGAARVAKADPDGYTILLHHIGQATSATLYRKLPYDTLTAFAPIGLVTDVPMTIVGRADLPPANVTELLAYIKENGDKITLANAGIGAASHLCGMMLMAALDTPMTTVPYKGTGPAMTDLLGGQVDLLCDQTTNTTGHLQSGKIKGYAVTTKTPVPALPDLPTLDSSGVPGFEVAVWHGLYAPAGTPQQDIDKLAAALQGALKDPKVIERFAALGTEPVGADSATPAALDAHLKAEIARWKPVIEAAGVYAD
ncbi:MAG: tripartite tricarboxylate transporter substrate-binding protein [Geminicoccaceae bacterium]